MSVAPSIFAALAAPGPQSLAVPTAICVLVREGAELGELEERTIMDAGAPRTIRVPPVAWFDRLAAAAEGGVFERQTPKAIAERILSTEAPEAA